MLETISGDNCDIKVPSPVLELDELVGDLVDVNVVPEDVLVSVDLVQDVVVELVELLHHAQLPADVVEAGKLLALVAEQHRAVCVRHVLLPQSVEAILKDTYKIGLYTN